MKGRPITALVFQPDGEHKLGSSFVTHRVRQGYEPKRMSKTAKSPKRKRRKLTARQLTEKFPNLQPNDNCLTNIACPECGNRNQFRIEMKSVFTLRDDGTDGYEDADWGQNAYCQCGECQHEGKVRDFTFAGLDDLLQSANASKA